MERVEALLSAGTEALRAGDWSTARATFERVLERQDDAVALAGLGDALWWLGDTEAAVRYTERAHAAFAQRLDPVQAALTAVTLYFLYRISLGNTAASRGWLGRLARLVEDFQLAPLEGWVLLLRAHDTDDPAAAERWAGSAHELARRTGDADLELCALSQRGAALVQMGRIERGQALLDEAMAASLAGTSTRPHTVVYTSCNLIGACSEIADIERVSQWIRAADGFTSRYGSPHLYTHCRIYYGGVLFALGDWTGAERELMQALRAGRSAERALHGEALARLAELRLTQGRLEEAERLLEGFEDHATSIRVLAMLRMARGDPAAAARLAQRRLRELDERDRARPGPYRAGAAVCLEIATLLELLTGAHLALGDPVEALAAARRLEELGDTFECEVVAARAHRALGQAVRATDGDDAALVHLERSLSAFVHLAMPLEGARTRLLLARTLVARSRQDAVDEARTALSALEALGANHDADAAAELLRSLGVRAARGGRSRKGALTKREREVLELLGEGLTNQEMSERLFLSRRTVEHHVRSVLSKLGLHRRAEAAAYAVRHLHRTSATENPPRIR